MLEIVLVVTEKKEALFSIRGHSFSFLQIRIFVPMKMLTRVFANCMKKTFE